MQNTQEKLSARWLLVILNMVFADIVGFLVPGVLEAMLWFTKLKRTIHMLEDIKINTKVQLTALWTAFMFLYIYVDYFHLYMPGSIRNILAGKMFVFDITQGVLLTGLASVTIPALMIFLSVVLTAKVNRWTNIIVATVYIPYTLFNLAGEAWMHMVFGAVVEVVLLSLIISYAWKWPRQGSEP